MRKQLKLDSLSVTSFETGSAAAISAIGETQEVECDSPRCGPSAYRTCEDCPAGLGV